LKALGLEVITGVRTAKTRRIILRSVNSVTSVTDSDKNHDENDASDATDASLHTSSSGFTMAEIKSWCLANRNERSEISLHTLAKFIEQELKENSQRVIQIAFKQAILMSSPKVGMAVVV